MVTDRHLRRAAGKWGTSGGVLGAVLPWPDRALVVELKCLIPPCLFFFWPHKPPILVPKPCPACCSVVREFSGKVGGSKLQFHPRLSQQHHNCCWWKRVMIQADSSSPGDGEEKRDAPASLLPVSWSCLSMELSRI